VPAYLRVRPLSAEEAETVERLARSRTASARAVERAQIIWLAHQGARVATIAARLGVCAATVRTWVRRFNAAGLVGLADVPRAGRPAT
jgi:transposase